MVTKPDFPDIAGDPCLDFANTLDGVRGGKAVELLASYEDLVAWSRFAGLIPPAAARGLRRQAGEQPAAARAVLERAIDLREAIFRTFAATSSGRRPPAAALERINGEWSRAAHRARVEQVSGDFAWGWTDAAGELDAPLGPIARAAADLLTSPDLARVAECASEDCSWLFLDTTRNHGRRWCEMRVCGNRAKVRRFRDK